jgi:hypothetical protein
MRPRLAAALVSILALTAAALLTTGAVRSGASGGEALTVAETPTSTLAPERTSLAEIDEAIARLFEAIRSHAQQQAASAQAEGPTPEQPASPQQPPTPEATPSPSSPEPKDASADPDCVTERESRPGVLVTSVRCRHQNVTQDGSSSSVIVSSSSSISVSSSSTSTP